MAMESAKSFVQKFYTDNDFMKKLYKLGVFIGGKANNAEDAAAQNRKITEVANQIGYNFSTEEYEAANSEYVKSLGAWKGIKVIFHMMKVGKSAEREQKKENKAKS